jgi:endonuclease-3
MNSQSKSVQTALQQLEKMKQAVSGMVLLEEIQTENAHENPFRILISTVLSVRNKDEATHEATETLFEAYSTPQQIADAPIEEIEKRIKKSGMYKTKAQRIKEISKILIEKFGGNVPATYNELISLPGVGPKVANCVLVYAFKTPAIPVDTHVHRISNRIGWVSTKNPEETEKKLSEFFPIEAWNDLNWVLVLFGKQICKPIGPKCTECPVTESCPKIISKPETRKIKSTKNPQNNGIKKNSNKK